MHYRHNTYWGKCNSLKGHHNFPTYSASMCVCMYMFNILLFGRYNDGDR